MHERRNDTLFTHYTDSDYLDIFREAQFGRQSYRLSSIVDEDCALSHV